MAPTFFENRRYAAVVILIVAVVIFLLLFIVWPWRNVLVLTLWGAFILYYPTRWLQKHVRRRGLAAALILIGIFVVSPYRFAEYPLHSLCPSLRDLRIVSEQ